MSKNAPKTIKMRNELNRSYNGIRPQEIVEVKEDFVEMYKEYGFEKYTGESNDEATEEDGGSDNTDIQARKDFLKEKWVKFNKWWKDATIIKKSDKLGYGVQEEDGGSDDLDEVDVE